MTNPLIKIVDPQEASWLEAMVAQPEFKYRIKFADTVLSTWSMYLIFQMLNGCGYVDGETMYLYQDKDAPGTKQEVYVTELANLTTMRLLGRASDLKQYEKITIIEERQ
jgi:hypothetical protein